MMNATTFRCKCGHDQEILFEVDGYKVLDVRTEDGELKCEVCGEALDRDEVYSAASIAVVEDMAERAEAWADAREDR